MTQNKNRTDSSFNIRNFIQEESFSGKILIVVTIIALVWANSPWYDQYKYLWYELKLGLTFGDFGLKNSIQHWINDGLMAVFFFMIGLEIKREVIAGELSTIKKAGLPLMAALGGMVIPAAFYVAVNYNNPQHLNGWGIPMATDIAFALGIMAMLGDRVPTNLKIFLTALAIADDLGAILVIAIFYTESINIYQLVNAGIFLVILMGANRLGVRRTWFYAVVGLLGVWLSFLFSGVHATIAGVLIALTIPARPRVSESRFIDGICTLVDRFKATKSNDSRLLTQKQSHLITDIEKLTHQAHTPLQKLEHALHPITAFLILPIFALANAGVRFEGSFSDMLFHPIAVGIMLGLVAGKALGISLFSKAMVRLRLAVLPEGVSWKHIYGASFFAGIGFTMSIFISGLAFVPEEFVQISKVGVFGGSLISALVGVLILARATKKPSR